MRFSRRSFVKTAGLSGASLLALRGERAAAFQGAASPMALPPPRLLLHNNENPLGPGQAVHDAIRAQLKEGVQAGRYPAEQIAATTQAIAERFGAKSENVLLGCGSTQVLRSAVEVFTSNTKALVSAIPTYEECMDDAALLGRPVRAIPLDPQLRLDLNAMAEASTGAGLVFVNNPNNPTATVWSGDAIGAFVDRVLKASPDTTILIDEAYHDYVTDPSHRTQVPLALKNPRILVARTFSKAHGMAGMRTGYVLGMPETIKKLSSWESGGYLNIPGLIAAAVSIKDQARLDIEKARNTEARQYTVDWFKAHGCVPTDSQCNFIFVNVNQPVRAFRDACRKEGVLVARDFPPYANSHCRISIGTLDEMKQATEVFGRALAAAVKAA